MSSAKQGQFSRLFDKAGYHENGNRGSSRRHPALPPNMLAVGIELEMEHLDGYHRIFEAFPIAQRIEDIPWFAGLHYRMGVDGISVLFVTLTAFLLPICIAASWKSVGTDCRPLIRMTM